MDTGGGSLGLGQCVAELPGCCALNQQELFTESGTLLLNRDHW